MLTNSTTYKKEGPLSKRALLLVFISVALSFIAVATNAYAAATKIRTSPSETIRKELKSFKEMRDANIVKQGFDYSCGAASLATLMKFYFKDDITELEILKDILSQVDDEELRKKEGFSLLDLKAYAESKGYRAAGFRMDLLQLKKLLGPVIVHITPRGYKHFAVLKGIRGDRVYLADPSRGNIRMSVARFKEIWGGIVFVLDKGGGLVEDHSLKLKVKYRVQPELLGINQLMDIGRFTINPAIRSY